MPKPLISWQYLIPETKPFVKLCQAKRKLNEQTDQLNQLIRKTEVGKRGSSMVLILCDLGAPFKPYDPYGIAWKLSFKCSFLVSLISLGPVPWYHRCFRYLRNLLIEAHQSWCQRTLSACVNPQGGFNLTLFCRSGARGTCESQASRDEACAYVASLLFASKRWAKYAGMLCRSWDHPLSWAVGIAPYCPWIISGRRIGKAITNVNPFSLKASCETRTWKYTYIFEGIWFWSKKTDNSMTPIIEMLIRTGFTIE